MSVILTVVGVQLTFEFHEPTRGACVVAGDAKTGNAIWIIGMRRRVNVIIAVIRENRTTVSILYLLALVLEIPDGSLLSTWKRGGTRGHLAIASGHYKKAERAVARYKSQHLHACFFLNICRIRVSIKRL